MIPALSYVVPAFNAEATIGDTLRSLVGQGRSDWEAVVVDDGSRDGTAAAAAAIGDGRIRVVAQANRGLAAARNAGASHTLAPALCFLDADDAVDPSHAESMLAALRGHDLAACGTRFAGPAMEDLEWSVCVTDRDLRPEAMLRRGNPVAVGAVVADRGVLRLDAGRGLFDQALPVLEDWEAWLRLTRAGAVWAPCVERALFTYRLRPASMSQDLRLMWRTGLGVIRASGAGEAARGEARRTWTLRWLARAVARRDADFRDELLRALGPLSDGEPALLAAELRGAFCREEIVPPRRAREREDRWRASAEVMLAGVRGVDEVLDDLRWPSDRCEGLAAAAAAALRSGRPVAIYGMGRNARRVIDALERAPLPASPEVCWVDDDPAAAPPRESRLAFRRLAESDLTPAHTVVVTPDLFAPILPRLARLGIAGPCTGAAAGPRGPLCAAPASPAATAPGPPAPGTRW